MPEGFKQIGTQTQQQVQTLSPQQVLVVKLLELPALELEDRVRAEVLENPALESDNSESASEAEEGAHEDVSDDLNMDKGDNNYDSKDDYWNADDIPDYKLQDARPTKQQIAEEIPFSDAVSFYDILKDQLAERELSEEDRQLGEYLIGSLDDDGLLRKPLDSIADELAIYQGIDTSARQLEKVLKLIQDFDPAGVGARSLQECLRLQIFRKEDSELKNTELRIIDKCYEDFTRKHWDKIVQRLNISEEEFNTAIGEIKKLNPRPGSSLGEAIGRNYQQIIPDFIVETYDDGSINLSLNNHNMPQLHLSQDWRNLIEEHTKNKANLSKSDKEYYSYIKQKMDAAQGFIDAVKQRQNTLMSTMRAIIELQRPFFQEGDDSLLRPMILKDVAEKTGLDISTISRVSNSKYVQTNFGIFPLKVFFNDSYITEDGEELSTRKIRNALKEMIDKENKTKPLTDDELADILKEQGFPVARRTVAKYRQQLNIPVARLRK